MKKDNLIRLLFVSVCIVLIAAMALLTSGCEDKKPAESTGKTVASTSAEIVGEGKTAFKLSVTDGEKNEKLFTVNTEKKTVGEALKEVKLIDGKEDSYGFMVDTVNGIKADYDKDKTYWAFYIDGNYATKGPMDTEIEKGKSYGFKLEK